jgi:hypothetical protein
MATPPESSTCRRVVEQDHQERRVKHKPSLPGNTFGIDCSSREYVDMFNHYNIAWKDESSLDSTSQLFSSRKQVIRVGVLDDDKPAIDYFFSKYKDEAEEMNVSFREDGTFHINFDQPYYAVTAQHKGLQITGATRAYSTKISEGLYMKKVYVQSKRAKSTSYIYRYLFYFYDISDNLFHKLPLSIYTSKQTKSKVDLPIAEVISVDLKTFINTEVQTDISLNSSMLASNWRITLEEDSKELAEP